MNTSANDLIRTPWGRRALAAMALPALLLLAATAAFGAEARQREGVSEVVYQVNVNTATAEQLQLLYRTGPVLAGKIIAERANGPFANLADVVDRVSGIGARWAACNGDFVSFDGETDLQAKITCA